MYFITVRGLDSEKFVDSENDYPTHTTKPDTCFGVRQDTVLVSDETKQVILIVDLVDFLVGTHKNICEHVT